MCVMAVSTDGRAHVAARDCLCVHAFPVRKKNLVADAAAPHDGLVAVTTSAGLGDVRAMDRRFWIACGQHRRQVAVTRVAIAAERSLRAVLFCLRMEAVVVSFVRFTVKERTGEIGKLLAGAVTALTLQVRWRRGRGGGVWFTDDCAFVWADRCRAGILISLRFG